MSLVKTSSGLIFFDDFVEPGTGTEAIANGWNEIQFTVQAPVIDRDNDWMRDDPTGNNQNIVVMRDSPTQPGDVIVQVTARSTQSDDSGIPGIRIHSDDSAIGAQTTYDFSARHAQGWFVRAIVSGALDGESSGGDDATFEANDDYSLRAVAERSGADTLLRMYAVGGDPATNVGTPNSDPNKGDLTLLGSFTDSGRQLDGDFYGIEGHDLVRFYFILACGRNVTVTGLPAGWKARLDGVAATLTVETGGVAVIDVDDLGLPAATVEVLDPGNNVMDSLTPPAIEGRQGDLYSGGIVGGDTFLFSSGPPDLPAIKEPVRRELFSPEFREWIQKPEVSQLFLPVLPLNDLFFVPKFVFDPEPVVAKNLVIRINPELDSSIWADASTTNFGSDTTLDISVGAACSRGIVLQFNLAGLVADDIESAELRITADDAPGSNDDYWLRPILRLMVEDEVTWNLARSGVPWTTPGAGGGGTDINSGLSWVEPAVGAGQTAIIDDNTPNGQGSTTFTDYIKANVGSRVGFRFVDENTSVGACPSSALQNFRSKEHPTASTRPVLVIQLKPTV